MVTPRRAGQLSWPEVALYGGVTAYGWLQFWTFAFAPTSHIWLWYPAGHAAGCLMLGAGCMQLSLSRLLRERKITSADPLRVEEAKAIVARAAEAAQIAEPKVVVLNDKRASVSGTRILKTGSIEITSGALVCATPEQMHALVTRELVANQRADARKFFGSMPSSWFFSGFRAQVIANRAFGAAFEWPWFLVLSGAIIGAKRLRNGWMRKVQSDTDMAGVDLLGDGQALASGLERFAKHNLEAAPLPKRLAHFLLAQNPIVQRFQASVWHWDMPVALRCQQIRERGNGDRALEDVA